MGARRANAILDAAVEPSVRDRAPAEIVPLRKPQPLVAVMLCTKNGDRFLEQQLRSIAAQTLGDFTILASDDGSTDDTLEILERARDSYLEDRLTCVSGPGTGFQENFLSVFRREAPPARYIAFCDQDDIWLPHKLERAVRRLDGVNGACPAIYGSRTILIDEEGRELGLSPDFGRTPSFANALVQSLFGGNTMMINEAAWHLARRMLATPVVSHDWWMYQIVSGVGGVVIYDRDPTVLYRQHESNLIGSNRLRGDRIARFSAVMGGRYQRWNGTNTTALNAVADCLTMENQATLRAFESARRGGFVARLRNLRRARVYRQNLVETAALWLAAMAFRI